MSGKIWRKRRLTGVLILIAFLIFSILLHPSFYQQIPVQYTTERSDRAIKDLHALKVKGRAPKTGYSRKEFGNGWKKQGDCDTRNMILLRDLKKVSVDDNCKVMAGELNDPYTGKLILFKRGPDTSDDVQIDHVVALSNAWQTGAQQMSYERRIELANDSLELLAVDGQANQDKSDGDAATWLPKNKTFRCQYVARQIQVKTKYALWLTEPEKAAMVRVLAACK